MSVPLDPIDTTAFTTGTAGTIDWTGLIQQGGTVGVRAGKGHVRILNESGAGLLVKLASGAGDHIPAGGWLDLAINGDNTAAYTVEYVMAGPSPNKLLVTVYEPGEAVPPLPVLGNSPVGVGGTVSTSAGTSLKNDGNGPGTSTYEATPSDQAASSIQDYNDGSGFRKILSKGVLRTVWNIVRGNATTGQAAVQIGDPAERSTFTYSGQLDELSSDAGKLTSDGAGNLTAAKFIGPLNGNADTATSATSASKVGYGASGTTSDPWGYPLDSATGLAIRTWSRFSGSGAGTFNHNMNGGQTPNILGVISTVANSTETVGVDSLTSTTVHVDQGVAGWAWWGFAGKA